MSLRRRITAATTIAVAAVALLVGIVGYASDRSHLIGETRNQLSQLANAFLHGGPGHGHGPDQGAGNPNGNPGGNGYNQPPDDDDDDNGIPIGAGGLPHPAFGGEPGDFQAVYPSGKVKILGSSSQRLPVTADVLEIARTGRGRTSFSATVAGTHIEVLAIPNTSNDTALEVAVPLGSVDTVLHGLLITNMLLVGGGVLLAVLIGTFVARAALRPINRFTDQTEQVTSELARPRRLEETGATELRRLATSFNQTLDALEASIQAQRHLIADASHELRTPMAALRSNIQIFLEADRLPAEERQELQDSIVAELDELTQLVSDVLDLARGASPSDHIESIELDTIVREAVARTQRRAPQLSFETDLEPTVIENAPERVARAVTNVIDNARKWSPPDGVVEISLHEGRLRVRDHGPGFNESDIPHVFDRFYRADEARRLPGSGLGLAIVRQAAEAYGGLVSAFNAEDGGAVIEIVFGSRPAHGVSA